MLAVQVGGVDGGDEELRAVGVGAGVGHGQEARGIVSQGEGLVVELVTVDGLAASAVAGREVAALEHELGDHAVERAALVVERLAGLAGALLSGAEGSEVLSGTRHNVGTQHELDAARWPVTDGYVEEHFGTGRRKI